MPVNSVLFIDGLGHIIADAGIPINSLPVISGSKGIVTDFSIIWGGEGLPPNDGFVNMVGAPYPGAGATAFGTDSNGSIGVAKSFSLAPPFDDDTQWDSTGTTATLVLADGFWATDVRVFINDITGTRRIQVDIVALELSDLDETLSDTPTNVDYANESWDPIEEEGSVDLSWSFDNTLAENPNGFAIVRDGEIIGTVPFVSGTTSYGFTDYVHEEGTYSYVVQTYKYGTPNVSSPPSSPPVVPTFSGSGPDINVTTDLTLAFDWNSVMAFITDPSGIYGLIPNKTHDTLYNRAVETSVDVKIPDPFVRLAFIPEEE